MNKDQIVIVTQMDDPHADDMIVMLEALGHEPIRLNTDDIPSSTSISLDFSKSSPDWAGTIEILTNGRIIDVEQVRSVWWRRPAAFGLPEDLTEQEREFAEGEIEHVLRSLWASLECYWVSRPDNIRRAGWKGEQLRRAARLGFEVPRTLITTDPAKARDFYETCDGRVVFKVMTDPFLGAPKISLRHPDRPPPEPYETTTTLVTEAELALLDTVRFVPCMFQEYVPKDIELRVTVIGDEIFAAEIHSQADSRTSVDWRHHNVEIPYRRAILPAAVAKRCLALVRGYGLNFSAIDLVLTPDGRYVFIENNPNGQFIFVERLVPELGMTEALASCLIRGANS